MQAIVLVGAFLNKIDFMSFIIFLLNSIWNNFICGQCFLMNKKSHISSMQDTPRNIHAKFDSNWSSSVRREDFWKFVNNDKNSWRQRTPSDGNNSSGLWPVELKNALTCFCIWEENWLIGKRNAGVNWYVWKYCVIFKYFATENRQPIFWDKFTVREESLIWPKKICVFPVSSLKKIG